MASSAREFFDGLETRIDPVRTRGQHASYRFDVEGAGSWRLEVDDGTVTVEESDREADCLIRANEQTFLRVVEGTQNPMTAYMTGKIKIQGDVSLALKLRELIG